MNLKMARPREDDRIRATDRAREEESEAEGGVRERERRREDLCERGKDKQRREIHMQTGEKISAGKWIGFHDLPFVTG